MTPSPRWARVLSGTLMTALLLGCAFAHAQVIVVDNESPQFAILYGTWDTGTYGQPYGTNYHWALTTGYGSDPAEVEWRPNLPQAGSYRVEIWYVQGGNRANNAVFTIHHADGATPVVVNQQINGEVWLELGTFTFNAGTGGYVRLHNDANAAVVIADAVRFTPVSAQTVTLTLAASPPTWGTTTPAPGSHTRLLNESVPIAASSYGGYVFDHWTVSAGAPVANPTAASTTVTMDQDKTVTAVFAEAPPVAAEFRGFWADAFHEGFKSAGEIDAMIARALQGNYNALIPEVLAYQDTGGGGHGAYWNSSIVPKAADISPSGFDPLVYLVQQAHAAGLEVHCWLVTYRISTSWPPAGNPTLTAHPEWLSVPRSATGGGPAQVGGKYLLDPGSPDAQEYLLTIVRELIENYDIDGIHWDYVRYETDDAGYPAYNWYTRSGLTRFQTITGYAGTPPTDYEPWNDFRRREVTELVRRAQVVVATTDNPRQPLRHTVAGVTWYPANTNFHLTRPYYDVFSDWEDWQLKGYVDATIPMAYFDENSYPATYRAWVDNCVTWANNYNRHTYIGPGIYMNTFADSTAQMLYARSAGAHGMNTYSYRSTNDGGEAWSDWYPHAAANIFTAPAPLPTMPWRYADTAIEGCVYGRVTDGPTGQPLDNATLRLNGFAVSYSDGNGFFVLSRINANVGGTAVPVSVSYPGYTDAVRPAVLVLPAGFTEANLALGAWLPGDYDVDGDVDIDDYDRLEPCFTGPDQGPPAAGCDLFDRDGDNDVDLSDWAVFQTAFTG